MSNYNLRKLKGRLRTEWRRLTQLQYDLRQADEFAVAQKLSDALSRIDRALSVLELRISRRK